MSGFAVGGIVCCLFWRGKWLNICVGGGRWCQVLELVLGAFGVIEELKNPVLAGGLMDKFCFFKVFLKVSKTDSIHTLPPVLFPNVFLHKHWIEIRATVALSRNSGAAFQKDY